MMMRLFYTFLLIVVAFTPSRAQKSNISLNIEKGKTYSHNTSSTVTIIQDLNGMEMEMEMGMSGTLDYLVMGMEGENYKLEARYKNVSMSMNMPQGSMSYNSEKKDEEDILSTMLGEMINKPFVIIMKKNGQIKEIRDIDVLYNSMFKKFPQIPEAQIEQLKLQLMKTYGEEAFRGNIEMVTSVFPDKEVAVGDTWSKTTILKSTMSASIKSTFELKNITDTYYVIEGASTIDTIDKDTYVESNGLLMKFDLQGTMKSTIKVDRKTGWIIESEISQDFGGNAAVKPNEQLPDGMLIPMDIESVTKITN